MLPESRYAGATCEEWLENGKAQILERFGERTDEIGRLDELYRALQKSRHGVELAMTGRERAEAACQSPRGLSQ